VNRAASAFLVAAVAVPLAACVVVPRTVLQYDPECRILARQMTLQPVQLASLGGCANSGCAALLGVVGVTAAASTVISGSIAVVGNVVYWLERRGQCARAAETVPPPLPPPAAPASLL
jgi:hypothetical protein